MAEPSYEDFDRDYHAPDRDQVLANMRRQTQPVGPSAQGIAVGENNPSTPAPPAPSAPQAPVGHNDSFNGQNREQWRDAWMGSGPQSQQSTDAWMQANGATKMADNGTFRTPWGETLDLGQNYRTGNVTPAWTIPGGGGAAGGAGGTAGAAMSAAQGGLANGGPGVGQAGGGDFQSQIRQMLLKQMQGAAGGVDPNDPTIKGEIDSQTNSIERNRRARRSADAERAAMNGLLNGGQSAGSFEQDIANGFEDAGRATTDMKAQIFSREMQAKRTQMNQMLQMAMQSGDGDATRALQMQLAQMDAELRRMGLSQNQSQWNDSFGLNAAQFQYGKDRDLANYGAGS